jgi:hypothetical protein
MSENTEGKADSLSDVNENKMAQDKSVRAQAANVASAESTMQNKGPYSYRRDYYLTRALLFGLFVALLLCFLIGIWCFTATSKPSVIIESHPPLPQPTGPPPTEHFWHHNRPPPAPIRTLSPMPIERPMPMVVEPRRQSPIPIVCSPGSGPLVSMPALPVGSLPPSVGRLPPSLPMIRGNAFRRSLSADGFLMPTSARLSPRGLRPLPQVLPAGAALPPGVALKPGMYSKTLNTIPQLPMHVGNSGLIFPGARGRALRLGQSVY